MFERLVESESTADLRPRRNYFLMTFFVIGILFLTAVVVSLYAQGLDLDVGELEMFTMVAPVTPEAPESPEPETPQSRPQNERSERPNRHANVQNIIESPIAPTSISSMPSNERSRPVGAFDINRALPESDGIGSSAPGDRQGFPNVGTSASDLPRPEVVKRDPEPEPPPARKVEKPSAPVSLGVINGRATHLPRPPYPAPAIAIRAEGQVTVQVTIDEQGNVISARAVSGHALLKGAAEKAAWGAKFTPTTLSKQPVKVTGVIVYKFSRN